VRQAGRVLMRDEVDGPSTMLTGYRRFGSESAARTALRQEGTRLVGEGLAPAGAEASALVAESPQPASANPSLPIRRDVYVYNEATGFMLTSQRMAGKTLRKDRRRGGKRSRSDIVPLTLVQDDSFVIRVVIGDELDEAERE
jgi:hypothetical protein